MPRPHWLAILLRGWLLPSIPATGLVTALANHHHRSHGIGIGLENPAHPNAVHPGGHCLAIFGVSQFASYDRYREAPNSGGRG